MAVFVVVGALLLSASVDGVPAGVDKVGPNPLQYQTYEDTGRYMFNPVPQNWTDASKICREYNGHLAYPNTEEEASVLRDMLSQYKAKQVHAGFHDQYIEGTYYTVKGQRLNESGFEQWSSGYPVGGPEWNCGGLRGDGLMDEACEELHPSICEENEISGPNALENYTLVPGFGFFKFRHKYVRWPVAMDYCYQEGAGLWVINSEEELITVLDKFNITNDGFPLWVGVHQLHAEGYFVTIYDEELEATGFSKWWGPSTKNSYVAVRREGLYTDTLMIQSYMCEYNPYPM